MSRRPELAVLGLAAFVLALHGGAVFGHGVFFQRDIVAYWLPHIEAVVRVVAEGSGPWWNPWVGFGTPLLADPALQLAYPPTWLNLLVPPHLYYAWFVAGHAMFGGLGVLRLARRLGLRSAAAALAALALVGAGPWVSAASLWHHYAGMAWMPWVLGALEPLLARPTRTSAARLGLVAGLQSLAGSADLCLMTALAALVRVAPRLRQDAALRVVGAGLGAIVLAAGLGAVQWGPTLAVLDAGSRTGMDAATRGYWSVHPASLIDLFVPGLLGQGDLVSGARDILFEGREPFLSSMYLGAAALGLVLLGLAAPGAARVSLALGLSGFLVASLGRYFPPVAALQATLPLSLLRYPVKYVLPAALFWSLLVACGFDHWMSEWRSRERQRARLVAAVLFALATVTAASAGWVLAWPADHAWWLDPASPPAALAAAGRFGLAATLLLATAGLLFVRARAAFSPVGPSAALFGLVALDLLSSAARVNPLAPPELWSHRPPLVDRLQRESDQTRVYSAPISLRELNRGVVRGPAGWAGEPRFVLGTLDLLRPPQGARWRLRGSFDGDFTGQAPPLLGALGVELAARRDEALALTLLRLGNVGHVVSLDARPFGGRLRLIADVDSVFARPVRLHQVPEPVPAAYVVGAVWEIDDASALRAFSDAAFDPNRVALVPPGSGLGLPIDAPSPGDVVVRERRADRLRLDVDLQAAGLLVLVEADHPGWSAHVDGRPTPLVRTNLLFRGVPLQPGRSVVELRYAVPALLPGCLASAAALAAGLFLARRQAGASVEAGEAAL